ncbi:MAG: TOBE domain-containing protein, partial [Hyphomicrobiales bacterium]
RPEALMLAGDNEGIGQIEVSIVEYLGDESVIHGRLGDGTPIILREKGAVEFNTGDKVSIDIESVDALHFFSPETGERIVRSAKTPNKG